MSATAETVTSTFRVGADWISLTLPRSLLEPGQMELPANAVVTVEANGIGARLDAATLSALRAAEGCALRGSAAEEARAFQAMADSFVDLPRFLNHVRGYLEIERQLGLRRMRGLLRRMPVRRHNHKALRRQ